MRRVFLFAVLLALNWVPMFAQTQTKETSDGGCIMYGQDHVFGLKLPKGWVVNPTIGQSLGLHAVMYPEGSSWKDSVVTMYSNFVHKGQKKTTLEEIIADHIAGYKKESPNLKVLDAGPLPLGGGKERVVVKYFSGDVGGNFDAVAYIDENKVVIMIVLTSRTEEDFTATLPAFKQTVGSYLFISENVTFPK